LEKIFQNLKINHPSDWLLPLEIYELISETDSNFSEEVLKYLLHLKTQRPKIAHLIDGGLELLSIKTNETI
jgi:phenylalanine-4-hydroxylase